MTFYKTLLVDIRQTRSTRMMRFNATWAYIENYRPKFALHAQQ